MSLNHDHFVSKKCHQRWDRAIFCPNQLVITAFYYLVPQKNWSQLKSHKRFFAPISSRLVRSFSLVEYWGGFKSKKCQGQKVAKSSNDEDSCEKIVYQGLIKAKLTNFNEVNCSTNGALFNLFCAWYVKVRRLTFIILENWKKSLITHNWVLYCTY